jgi:MFS family permease
MTVSVSIGSPRLPWGLAWRLALGQICAWGTFYYAFTVVVGPMEQGTGWTRTFLNLGLSLGLLTWGLGAYPAGLWIQRHGARGLMAVAAMLGGLAFITLGLTASPALYLAAWIAIGAAMAGLLYDPAFAMVTTAFGEHYRRGITLITLVGGLASTAFIPLSQFLVHRLGWSHALVALGILQLAVVFPLHAFGLPAHRVEPAGPPREAGDPGRARGHWFQRFRQDFRERPFPGLAIWFAAQSAAFTGLMFQLVPLLVADGAAAPDIVSALMVMGPMQVASRFLFSVRGAGVSALRVGAWAMAGQLAALVVLLVFPPRLIWLALFAGLLGAGNGVMTIARGTVVPEFFGRARYAELNGALAAPTVLARAASPLAMAGIWSSTGRPLAVVWTALGLLLISTLGLASARRTPPP